MKKFLAAFRAFVKRRFLPSLRHGLEDSVVEAAVLSVTADLTRSVGENAEEIAARCTAISESKTGYLIKRLREKAKEDCLSVFPSAFPCGLKFLLIKGTATVFVIEQPPSVRTVNVLGKTRHCAFPFVVFIVVLNNLRSFLSLHIFFRTEPLTCISDEVCIPTISSPNIHEGRVCIRPVVVRESRPSVIVESIIQEFWGSQFQRTNAFDMIPEIKTWEDWESLTMKTGEFTWSLKECPHDSLQKVVSNILISVQTCILDSSLEQYLAGLKKAFAQELRDALLAIPPRINADVEQKTLSMLGKVRGLIGQTMERVTKRFEPHPGPNRRRLRKICLAELEAMDEKLQGLSAELKRELHKPKPKKNIEGGQT